MSGSIWPEEPPPPPPPDLYEGYRKSKSDVIEPARKDFERKTSKLKQTLMKLICIAGETESPKKDKTAAKIIEACDAVFKLSMDLTNETERDMYAICDMLAISLAATCAERHDKIFSEKLYSELINNPDAAYIHKALTTFKLVETETETETEGSGEV